MNQIPKIDAARTAATRQVQDSTRRIALIVDDSPIDRRQLKAMCDKAQLDLEFVEASGIAQMCEAMKLQTFDLIFIDYRLEDGDGLGALTLIKKDPKNRSAATIMVAGVAQAAVAVSALKSGCNDYVFKDALDPHWLKRAATNAMEKSRLERDIGVSETVRKTLETTLLSFSRECTVEMKPILSRMLRQVRALRSSIAKSEEAINKEHLDQLEQSCEQLWTHVEGFEGAAQDVCKRQWVKH